MPSPTLRCDAVWRGDTRRRHDLVWQGSASRCVPSRLCLCLRAPLWSVSRPCTCTSSCVRASQHMSDGVACRGLAWRVPWRGEWVHICVHVRNRVLVCPFQHTIVDETRRVDSRSSRDTYTDRKTVQISRVSHDHGRDHNQLSANATTDERMKWACALAQCLRWKKRTQSPKKTKGTSNTCLILVFC